MAFTSVALRDVKALRDALRREGQRRRARTLLRRAADLPRRPRRASDADAHRRRAGLDARRAATPRSTIRSRTWWCRSRPTSTIPTERLRAIHRHTRAAKEMSAALRVHPIGSIGETAPPWVLAAAMRLAYESHLLSYVPGMMNTIVSNVPGPTFPLYLAGARLTGHLLGERDPRGNGREHDVFSFEDRVDFGIHVDPDLVPDPWELAAGGIRGAGGADGRGRPRCSDTGRGCVRTEVRLGMHAVISGFVHPDFGGVTEALRRVATHKRGGGAAVAVYPRGRARRRRVDRRARLRGRALAVRHDGHELLHDEGRHRHRPCTGSSTADWSTTTNPSRRTGRSSRPAGKERVTVRHLLTHSAGTAPTARRDRRRLRDARLGSRVLPAGRGSASLRARHRHGYHGITYGYLVGEVIRRVTGMTVNDAVDAEIVKPLGLDGMSIGAPPRPARIAIAELIVRFGNAERAERFARGASRHAWLKPAIDAFMVPRSDRLFASSDMLDAADTGGQRLLHRSIAGRDVRGARGRRRARRRALPLGRDAAARDRDPVDRASTLVVGFPMRWRLGLPPRGDDPRRASPTASATSASAVPARGPTPTTNLAVAFVCNRVAGTPFGDTRLLRVGARARSAAAQRGERIPDPGSR